MIELVLSGVFFLLIIITNVASVQFGYETFSNLDSEAQFRKISNSPARFKISFGLILIEHGCLIALAVTLFLAFSQYNMALAVVWTVFRTGEGVIQIINKLKYWRLLPMAFKYNGASEAEKVALLETARNILITKNTVFTFAQVLFSLGTLAYSILFVSYEVVPVAIGWFGIIASIIYGFGSGIKLIKTDFKALWNVGGLLILLFELTIGGWLIINTLLTY